MVLGLYCFAILQKKYIQSIALPCDLMFFNTNSLCHNVCRCPCRLEIKAARDAVDVENLASKEQMWTGFAFQGNEVDAIE